MPKALTQVITFKLEVFLNQRKEIQTYAFSRAIYVIEYCVASMDFHPLSGVWLFGEHFFWS